MENGYKEAFILYSTLAIAIDEAVEMGYLEKDHPLAQRVFVDCRQLYLFEE